MSLLIEAGELAEHLRWHDDDALRVRIAEDPDPVADELADVLDWTLLVAHGLGIDLEATYERKMLQNERKHPVMAVCGSAKEYDESGRWAWLGLPLRRSDVQIGADPDPARTGGHVSDNPGCLGFLAGFFGKRSQGAAAPTYRLRADFLSAAELSYYRVLATAVAGRAVVLTKVRLADLFFVPRGEGPTGAWNRIAYKHVDFVLCDRDSMRPLVGVELDDRSHERSSRKERDGFVDDVFRVAGLPLLRAPVRSGYSVAELAAALAPFLGGGEAVRPDPVVEEPERSVPEPVDGRVAPTCPKCGVPMVLRTVGRGERKGEQFLGCPNYPRCRETVALSGGGV